MATFKQVSENIKILLEEQGTPRNVREKLHAMLIEIKKEDESAMKADRLLMQLDNLLSDINVPSYIRTGLMTLSSQLEDLEE